MACMLCELIKKKENTIYENEKIAVLLSPEPAARGHVLVCPKEHYSIIEQVPDYIISECFVHANKMCSKLFEGLQAQGTNVIINNGIPAGQTYGHFSISIIPRSQDDKLPLAWQPKQLADEQMQQVEDALKKAFEKIGSFEKEKSKPIEIKEEKVEEDYLIKSLRRLP